MKNLFYGFILSMIVAPTVVLAEWNVGSVNNEAQLPAGTIMGIIKQIMNWLLALVGIIGIIGFVISGIMYFLAAGDSGKAETAKNAMTYSIIGVIVALMGYVIIKAADALLGGSSSNF